MIIIGEKGKGYESTVGEMITKQIGEVIIMEKQLLTQLVNAVMETKGTMYLTNDGKELLTKMFVDHGKSLYANRNTPIPMKTINNVG